MDPATLMRAEPNKGAESAFYYPGITGDYERKNTLDDYYNVQSEI